MISTAGKVNFFSTAQNLVRKNFKAVIFSVFIIIIAVAGLQVYNFNKNKRILELSISYNDSKYYDSQIDFIEDMNKIAKTKSFYSLLASLELINNKINNEQYNESYDDYLKLLNNKKIDSLYKTLIAIHGSYNLIEKISNEKINKLVSYIDESRASFTGYRLELLFLLSITQDEISLSKSLYKKIIEDDKISLTIKERVKKINEFEKYN